MDDGRRLEITKLLAEVRRGDAAAEELLLRELYEELHRLASRIMGKERRDHTLQPTALVHEAYLRLFQGANIDYQDRNHFFALAARQMRRMLVDHAREKGTAKRGSGGLKVELSENDSAVDSRAEEIIGVDLALAELETVDPRSAKVVELKFFAGLSDKETAEALGLSFAAVRRDWEFARAWLFEHLR